MTDDPGIVFALELDGRGGGRHIGAESFGGVSLAWMHLDFSAREARAILEEQGLEPFIVDTLTRQESRPHCVSVGTGLMVILRGINRNAGADPEDMVSVRIWIDGDHIITVRQRPVMAAQTVRKALEGAAGPTSASELLLEIIVRLTDGIAEFVDDVEERIDTYEEAIDERQSKVVRGEISALRRQVATVRRYLAPQRDALESLNRLAGKLLDSEQVYALREQSDRSTRYIEDLDLVRERALVAQEELMNRVAHEQNARTYLFSVVATIFLPITFISGLFGMNTAGLPGLENDIAFWVVAGAMLVMSIGVIIWLRMKKWF
jgi:zinc transporter